MSLKKTKFHSSIKYSRRTSAASFLVAALVLAAGAAQAQVPGQTKPALEMKRDTGIDKSKLMEKKDIATCGCPSAVQFIVQMGPGTGGIDGVFPTPSLRANLGMATGELVSGTATSCEYKYKNRGTDREAPLGDMSASMQICQQQTTSFSNVINFPINCTATPTPGKTIVGSKQCETASTCTVGGQQTVEVNNVARGATSSGSGRCVYPVKVGNVSSNMKVAIPLIQK